MPLLGILLCFANEYQVGGPKVLSDQLVEGGTCSRSHSLRKAYTTEKYGFLTTAGSARRSLDHVPGLRQGRGLRVVGHGVGVISPNTGPD